MARVAAAGLVLACLLAYGPPSTAMMHARFERLPIMARGEVNNLTVGPSGDILLTTHWPSTLVRFEAQNGQVKTSITALEMDDPGAVAQSRDGAVWVADRHWYHQHYKIVAMEPGRVHISYLLPNAVSHEHVGDVTVDRRNNVWYVAPANGRVGFIDSARRTIRQYSLPMSAYSLATDDKNRLWAATGSPLVTMTSPEGQLLHEFEVVTSDHIFTPFISYARGRVWFVGYDNRSTGEVQSGWIDSATLKVRKCNLPRISHKVWITSVTADRNDLVIAPWGAQNIIGIISTNCHLGAVSLPTGAHISLIGVDQVNGTIWALDKPSRQLWKIATPSNVL